MNRTNHVDEAALWAQYNSSIYRYLFGLTGFKESAEDLTQETFLQAIRSLRRQPRPLLYERAWLFRIATNLANDLFRRRRLISWLPFFPDVHGEVGSDISESVVEHQLVMRALRRIPPENAALLLLKDGEGFEIYELAEMLGVSYDAVRKRLARARDAFQSEYLRLTGGEK